MRKRSSSVSQILSVLHPCLFFKLGNTFYRLNPTWRSVGCDAARLRLHTERGSSIPHAHETVVSHLITEAECNCNFTRSLQTAWGIWGRTIANCKISGSKTKLVRKRTCLAIACGPSENVDGVKISTWIHVWRTERGKGSGIVTSLAVTRRKALGWRPGLCRRPNRLKVGGSMDFAFYQAAAIGTEFTTGRTWKRG